jgi:hypothetical protein
MAYKVTVTYEIEVTAFAKDREPKEVERDLQIRAETSVGYGLPHFWRVKPGSVKVKAKRV